MGKAKPGKGPSAGGRAGEQASGDGDGVERRRRGGEGNGVNALGSDELGRAHTLAELGSDAQTLAELGSDELGGRKP